MTALYNEIAEYPAAWLENLIAAGHIAPGRVERRSLADLTPADLADVVQYHTCAGIGVWSYALRAAGWPDDVEVWSASLPCQPFSTAGRRKAFDDSRHLWPAFFNLVRECRPPVLVGEQVASPDGRAWLDVVLRDLESEGYACAAFDLSAGGFGAPHKRQRLYFVALADGERLERICVHLRERRSLATVLGTGGSGAVGVVADGAGIGRRTRRPGEADGDGQVEPARRGSISRSGGGHTASYLANDKSNRRLEGFTFRPGSGDRASADGGRDRSSDDGEARRMGHAGGEGSRGNPGSLPGEESEGARSGELPRRLSHESVPAGTVNGSWAGADWVYCRDNKYRPTQSILVKMADGTTDGVGHLRPDARSQSEEEVAVHADVQELRDGVTPQAVQRLSGRQRSVPSSRVLRPRLHGLLDGGADAGADCAEQPKAVHEADVAPVPELRKRRHAVVGSPSRREPAEQRAEQLTHLVRLVPQSIAFAELRGDVDTAQGLQALFESCVPHRPLLDALVQGETTWESLPEEIQDRLRVGFTMYVTESVRPCVPKGEPEARARAGRTAGYGNAIVADVAAGFISSVIDVLVDLEGT